MTSNLKPFPLHPQPYCYCRHVPATAATAHLIHSVAASSSGMSLGTRWKWAALNTPRSRQVPSAGSSGTTQSPTCRLEACNAVQTQLANGTDPVS